MRESIIRLKENRIAWHLFGLTMLVLFAWGWWSTSPGIYKSGYAAGVGAMFTWLFWWDEFYRREVHG